MARSLKRYPLPLKSGTEARILEGCGEKIAKMLDKRLAEHESENIPLEGVCMFCYEKCKSIQVVKGKPSLQMAYCMTE